MTATLLLESSSQGGDPFIAVLMILCFSLVFLSLGSAVALESYRTWKKTRYKAWEEIARERGGEFIEDAKVEWIEGMTERLGRAFSDMENPPEGVERLERAILVRWSDDALRYELVRSAGRVQLRGFVPEGDLISFGVSSYGGTIPAEDRVPWTRYQVDVSNPGGVDGDRFFTDRVGKNLDRIIRLDWTLGMSLKAEGRQVTVHKGSPLKLEQSLRLFINLSLPVIEQAIRVCLVTGIEILPDAPDGPTECQVCGGRLVARVVRCGGCGTPHHRECWDYAGRCSTYGCGGTKVAEEE